MKLFELPVRTDSWVNPPLKTLMMEDKRYEILGTGQGEAYHEYENTYYVLMLVMDVDQTEYLISTLDYNPKKIWRGSRDDLLGETFYQAEGCEDFKIGFKFYLSEDRQLLIPAINIKWDGQGCPYILDGTSDRPQTSKNRTEQ